MTREILLTKQNPDGLDLFQDAFQRKQPQLWRRFHTNGAKPFYPRLMFKRFVTLIHVTNEASESFWKMHAQFLWQEMYRICKTNPLRTCH